MRVKETHVICAGGSGDLKIEVDQYGTGEKFFTIETTAVHNDRIYAMFTPDELKELGEFLIKLAGCT